MKQRKKKLRRCFLFINTFSGAFRGRAWISLWDDNAVTPVFHWGSSKGTHVLNGTSMQFFSAYVVCYIWCFGSRLAEINRSAFLCFLKTSPLPQPPFFLSFTIYLVSQHCRNCYYIFTGNTIIIHFDFASPFLFCFCFFSSLCLYMESTLWA